MIFLSPFVSFQSGENKILSRFNSRDYLVRCITASCFIPLYSMGSDMMAQPPVIDNEVFSIILNIYIILSFFLTDLIKII